MRAAKWMGVKPWELADQSQVWTDWGLIAMSADDDNRNGFMAFIQSLFGR